MLPPPTHPRFAVAFVLALGALGCSGAAPALPAPSAPLAKIAPPDAPDPDAKFAPMPFSAAELREGCHEGRTIVMVEEVPDKLPVKRRMRFLAVDEERATIVSDQLDERDAPVGDPKTETSTWEQLRHHAAFPRESTTVSDATAETPLGTFACKRYVVLDGDTRTTVCFASRLPGPPVEMQIEKAGKLALTLTMVKSD